LEVEGHSRGVLKTEAFKDLEETPINQFSGIKLYPNPTDGSRITVSFANDISDTTLQLIDMSGIQQAEWSLKKQSSFRMPLAGVSNGVYVVRAITNKGVFMKKLIVTNN
jgi:hypothetical protein